ncbi:hypothetical protein IWW38_005029, partial [Coemansia aciculifera]
MKQLLVLILLAVASLGLPGVLDIGKLLSGGGLLDGVEKLLTDKDASPRASEVSSQSPADTETMRNIGESGRQSTTQVIHSSLTDSANNQRSASKGDTDGQNGQINSLTQQPLQTGASDPSATDTGTPNEDVDEDMSKAGTNEAPTNRSTNLSLSSTSTPKTVIHTQFVVVAPGEQST